MLFEPAAQHRYDSCKMLSSKIRVKNMLHELIPCVQQDSVGCYFKLASVYASYLLELQDYARYTHFPLQQTRAQARALPMF